MCKHTKTRGEAGATYCIQKLVIGKFYLPQAHGKRLAAGRIQGN